MRTPLRRARRTRNKRRTKKKKQTKTTEKKRNAQLWGARINRHDPLNDDGVFPISGMAFEGNNLFMARLSALPRPRMFLSLSISLTPSPSGDDPSSSGTGPTFIGRLTKLLLSFFSFFLSFS